MSIGPWGEGEGEGEREMGITLLTDKIFNFGRQWSTPNQIQWVRLRPNRRV